MRKHRVFRPSDLESLEGRVVLSSASLRLNLGGPIQWILDQVRDVRRTNQAFATFRQSYNNDIKTILLRPGTGGTIDIAANRTAFNEKVLADIQTLNSSIAARLTGLPSSTTLAANIRNKLLGSDPKSLESRLRALSTPTESRGFSLRVFRLNSALAITAANNQVDALIRRARLEARPGGGTSSGIRLA